MVVPRASSKAIGLAGKSSNRAEHDRIPDEFRYCWSSIRGAHFCLIAPVDKLKSMISSDELPNAGTSGTNDTTFSIKHQNRTKRDRFFKTSFFLEKAAFSRPMVQGLIL